MLCSSFSGYYSIVYSSYGMYFLLFWALILSSLRNREQKLLIMKIWLKKYLHIKSFYHLSLEIHINFINIIRIKLKAVKTNGIVNLLLLSIFLLILKNNPITIIESSKINCGQFKGNKNRPNPKNPEISTKFNAGQLKYLLVTR